MGITDMITFEEASVEDLEKDFRSAVDEYLKTCKRIGREPEKPFTGWFMLRVPSELHCAIALVGDELPGKVFRIYFLIRVIYSDNFPLS
jgi:predicted HicB family RNase H-like nuclease